MLQMNAADASARDYTEFFSRHLVGLVWYDGVVNSRGEFTSRPTYRCASGFLLQIFDAYWLVTAGHVVKDARSSQTKGGVGKNHSLLDWFSPRVVYREPIPFDFIDASLPPIYEPEIGVDVAFIPLPSFIVQQLLQTIEPITHERWIHQNGIEFDFYAILGTPAEATLQETKKDAGRRISNHLFPIVRDFLESPRRRRESGSGDRRLGDPAIRRTGSPPRDCR